MTRLSGLWARPGIVIATCCAGFFCVGIFGLNLVPYFGGDEVWPASTAATLVREGRFARDVTAGTLGTEIFDAFPPVWTLSLSAVYRLFGIGVWTTRIPSIVYGMLAVAMFGVLVWRTTRKIETLWFSVPALALDPILLQRVRIGRMEPTAVFFLLCAVLLVSLDTTIGSLAGGFLFIVAIASYQMAALGVIAAFAAALFFRRWSRLLWMATGSTIGVLTWALWVGNRYPLFDLQVIQVGRHYASAPWTALSSEWHRYRDVATALHGPCACLVYALGIPVAVLAWRNAAPKARALLLMTIVALVALALVGNKSPAYFMLCTAFLYFALAQAATDARPWLRRGARVLVCLSLLGGGAVIAASAYTSVHESTCRDPDSFVREMDEHLPEGAQVIGSDGMWLPVLRRNGRLRLLMEGYGTQSEPFQEAFLKDRAQIDRYEYIALNRTDEGMLSRYPEFADAVAHAQLVYRSHTGPACDRGRFAIDLYRQPSPRR